MSENVEIAPVQRTQLTEQVIERIKEYIEAKALLPGAKLPGERDLAAALGVSRNVTREAVRALQATGILEIQPGNGIFVAEFGFEALANHFNFVIRHQQHQLKHLVEARLMFENGILELVAGRLKTKDIALLEKVAHSFTKVKTCEEDIAAEIEFHCHMVRATGNPLLMKFADIHHQFFQEACQLVGTSPINPNIQRQNKREHMELVEALKNGEVERAKVIMESSTRRWEDIGR
jgi:GntR family transcriptional repressor for pyruvate dehydrogenase complex